MTTRVPASRLHPLKLNARRRKGSHLHGITLDVAQGEDGRPFTAARLVVPGIVFDCCMVVE